jgi:hypothetical protein
MPSPVEPMLSHKVVKGSQDDQVLCCTETSKHNIQKQPISGLKYKQRAGLFFQRRRSQEQFRSMTRVYSACQSCARLVPDRIPRVKYQVPHILLHQTIMIYFGNSGFGSFSFSPLAFIQSVFSRSPPIVVACPSKSIGGSLLRDFGLQEFRDFPSDFLLRSGATRPPEQTVNIYFGSSGFGSFSFPTPIFL